MKTTELDWRDQKLTSKDVEAKINALSKQQADAVTELNLSGNQISVIPECIGKLSNLTRLYLDSNQISVVPECIGKLTSLKEFSLNDNQISVIPECIGKLTNLKVLALNNNQISVIPECIGKLTNLTELFFNNNQITVIPECIGNLTNLTKLYLDSNHINAISECIGKLTNLTVLWLSYNQISVIPECIGKLIKLTKLGFHTNQISVISECIGKLTNLKELWLNNNQISVIPECIGKLTNLTRLFLYNNQINAISECIGKLTNLKELELYANQISVIPECIGKLVNLTKLHLSRNQISVIPECIGKLSNLTKLWLEGNKGLPQSLQKNFGLTANMQDFRAALSLQVQETAKSKQVAASPMKRAENKVPDLKDHTIMLMDVKKLLQGEPPFLGRGGFGEVYACTVEGTAAVVKKLLVGAGEEEIEAMKEEIKVLQQLKHPHVIQLLGWSVEPAAIVMERAELGSMDQLLRAVKKKRNGIMEVACAMDFCHQVSAGMVYLHKKNVLHRDLKSANVLLGAGLRVKLADFGLARVRESTYMRTGASGTVTHMAPECFEGVSSRKTDVYAYGMTCWEIMTLEQPYAGIGNPMVLMKKIETGLRPSLHGVKEDKMKELIQACWSGNPDKRPELAEIQAELSKLKTQKYPASKKQWRELEDLLTEK